MLAPQSATLPFGGGITTSGSYDPAEGFDNTGDGIADRVVRLSPVEPIELSSFTPSYLAVLTEAYAAPDWVFIVAVTPLSAGSLQVRTYDARHDKVSVLHRVGAQFHVEYVPGADDPTSNIHWIQVVWNNAKLPDPNGQNVGTIDFSVDNPFATSSPYYDDGGAANDRHFYDLSRRFDIGQDLIWSAQLMLVQGPPAGSTGTVTLLGGVAWGWQTVSVPEPASLLLAAMGFAGALWSFRSRVWAALRRRVQQPPRIGRHGAA